MSDALRTVAGTIAFADDLVSPCPVPVVKDDEVCWYTGIRQILGNDLHQVEEVEVS